MENFRPEFLRLNHLGEVPVIQHGDTIVSDSQKIIQYLKDNFNASSGIKKEGDDVVAKVDYFLELLHSLPVDAVTYGTFFHPQFSQDRKFPFISLVHGILRSRMLLRCNILEQKAKEVPFAAKVLLEKSERHRNRLKLFTDEESYYQLLEEVSDALQECEKELASHCKKNPVVWLCSNHFSEADCTLAVLLCRLEYLGYKKRFWADGVRPNLSAYYERVKNRESFVKAVDYHSIFFGLMKKVFYTHKGKLLSALFIGSCLTITSVFLYKRIKH